MGMRRKTILSIIMLFIMGIMFSPQNVYAKGAKLSIIDRENKNVKSITLIEGDSQNLKVASVKKKNIRWTSGDKRIAKVSTSGKVTAKGKGKTKIYAENIKTRKKAVCKVKVKAKVDPKKIKIAAPTKSCHIEETIQLTADISPKNATNKEVIWEAMNTDVATVDENGKVTAKAIGSCKIQAQIQGTRIKKSITVKVKDIDVTKISTSYGTNGITIEHGANTKLNYTIEPANVTNKKVTYKVADTTIATVTEDGVVTGGRPGQTTVTIKTNNGKKTTSVKVTVTANKGLLTKKDLEKFDFTSIDNLMIVAHPDDETIFGGGHLVEDDYFVVVLTNGWNKTRTNEFKKVLEAENDKGIILSYPDLVNGKRSDWKSVKNGILSDLKLLLTYKNWKNVVTHNPEGEYGHQHHIMTNNYVTQTFHQYIENKSCQLEYFGKFYQASKINNFLTAAQRLDDEVLAKKNKILSYYTSQQKIIGILSCMNPYEVWVPAGEWK